MLKQHFPHLVWAVAAIAVAFILGFFFGPRAEKAAVTTGTTINSRNDLQQIINAIRKLPSVTAPVSKLDQPAVSVIREVLPTAGFTDAELLSFAKALGSQKTATVIDAKLVGPTPEPIPTGAQSKLIYDAAYSADTNALAQSKIDVNVSQQPVPPSRFGVSYFSNGAAGLSYAFKRRGQFDLDADLYAHAGQLEPGASVVYRIKGTDAGLGAGVVLAGEKLTPGVTLSISF